MSRHPDKLDVFAVRTDGAIFSAAWDHNVENGAWRGWWSVAGGQTTPGVPVTALSRAPDKLDVFVVRSNGEATPRRGSAAWERGVQDGAWRGWWRVKDLVAYPGSAVAAVSRDPDKLDIFAVRNDGQIHCRVGSARRERRLARMVAHRQLTSRRTSSATVGSAPPVVILHLCRSADRNSSGD